MTAPVAPLGEVAEFVNGAAFKESDWSANGMKIIRIQNLTDPSKPYNRTTRKVKDTIRVRRGDLLVSWSATLGVFGWDEDEDAVLNQHIFRVIPDPSKVDKNYLRYMIDSSITGMTRHLHGATMKHITRKEFLASPIPLPSLEEQRRIASILDAADTLRTKRQQAIDQLDTLTQAIFYDMFGDPIANDRGWDRKPLAGISRGIYDCPHSTPEWTEQGEICLRTPNLGTGMWDWTDTRYVSNETFEERSKRAYLEAGDIVLSREGTVGVAAMVQPEMRMCMGQRLVQIQPDHEQVASPFLLAVLLFLLKPERIARVMAGSTVKHLNVKDLRDLEVIVPPKGQQESYVVASDAVERKREVIGSASTQLETLFSSLQQRAFRGDL